MIVIFGTARHTQPLGAEASTCRVCGVAGYRQQDRRYGVFHVFFIPLFCVDEQVVAYCPRCGNEDRIAAPSDAPPAPFLHRYGVIVPVVLFVLLGAGTSVAAFRKQRERAENIAHVAVIRDKGAKRLEQRLKSQEAHLLLGHVDGADPEAEKIAKKVAPLLEERLHLKAGQLGLHAVIAETVDGRSLLLLTQVPDVADVRAPALPAIASALGEVLSADWADGSWVTWSVMQHGDYVASVGARLGGAWEMASDPAAARIAAEEALNYEGIRR